MTNTWLTIHLSHQPSEPAYYILDQRISTCTFGSAQSCDYKTNDLSVGSTETKNTNQIFVNKISTLLYTLKRKPFFTLLFSCPSYSKCIKKLWNFHLHQQKIFWFLVLVLVSVDPTDRSKVLLKELKKNIKYGLQEYLTARLT